MLDKKKLIQDLHEAASNHGLKLWDNDGAVLMNIPLMDGFRVVLVPEDYEPRVFPREGIPYGR